ncbi:MAG: DUF3783 domain-containing protein [Desulfuromusa sp.]
MSEEGTFKKVEQSSEKMYGPRGLLVCGYPEPEQHTLLSLIKKSELSNFPVIFATNSDTQKTLKEVLKSDHKHGHGEVSDMKRAAIISGFTHKELHTLMADHRNSTLPTQHWAALTPISENWSVAALLDELAAEADAIKKQKNNP